MSGGIGGITSQLSMLLSPVPGAYLTIAIGIYPMETLKVRSLICEYWEASE